MSYDYRSIPAKPLSEIDLTSGERLSTTVVITPLDAQRLLRNNEKNRRLNQNTVLRYAKMMERGEWDWCDGDGPLKFGANGELRNGQHRLEAQVRANVTGVYDIRTGVPEKSYRVMDSGVKRHVADYFYGREQAENISALARRIVYCGYGFLRPTSSMTGKAAGRPVPTRNQEIEFAESHYDELLEYVRFGLRLRAQHRRGSTAVYSCALWISGFTKDDIESFVNAYVVGSDETSITKETMLKKLLDRNFKPLGHWYGGVTLMAYDAWTQGRGVKILRSPDVTKRYKAAVADFSSRWEVD